MKRSRKKISTIPAHESDFERMTKAVYNLAYHGSSKRVRMLRRFCERNRIRTHYFYSDSARISIGGVEYVIGLDLFPNITQRKI